MNKIIEISLDNWEVAQSSENLYDGRKNVVTAMNGNQIEVTIFVMAYNRLEKTKECVRSILENTKDVNYKLLLIDNGSTDQGDTLNYFQSVDYSNKVIIHINKNLGASSPLKYIYQQIEGKYLVTIANDLIVTPRWLSNMIKIAKSDDRIGMVNPMSSNVSNLQERKLEFYTYEEMQKQAERINVSDPSKWYERMRLVTLGTLYTCECLFAIGWPLGDVGFSHDFSDDDITFRVRRNGYKAILAGDTWIHHNHDFRSGENKDLQEYQHSMKIGRENFREKYFGIDAWDDVNNYIPWELTYINRPLERYPYILGIDVKCGTPLLEIKNKLREYSTFDVNISAFTQECKYQIDLKTICNGTVACDREEFIKSYFIPGNYSYIYIGCHINQYHEPISVLLDAASLLKSGGQLFVTLKNAFDIFAFLHMIGFWDIYNQEYCLNYPDTVFEKIVKDMGYKVRCLHCFKHSLSLNSETQIWIIEMIKKTAQGDVNKIINQLMTNYWVYEICK